MNADASQSLSEKELTGTPALASYVNALNHLAPGCVQAFRVARGEWKQDAWSAVLPQEREDWVVSVRPPGEREQSPLFWREPVVLRMLAALERNLSGKRPLVAWPQGVKAAWALITQHPSKPMSLGEVAACMKLSAGYLGARVEQVLGSTFRGLLRDERVTLACRLLLGTDLQIAEIAGQLGGQSLSQFNRNFAAATGISPRTYRTRYAALRKSPDRLRGPWSVGELPHLNYC